jgi:hypothetical protein
LVTNEKHYPLKGGEFQDARYVKKNVTAMLKVTLKVERFPNV